MISSGQFRSRSRADAVEESPHGRGSSCQHAPHLVKVRYLQMARDNINLDAVKTAVLHFRLET